MLKPEKNNGISHESTLKNHWDFTNQATHASTAWSLELEVPEVPEVAVPCDWLHQKPGAKGTLPAQYIWENGWNME